MGVYGVVILDDLHGQDNIRLRIGNLNAMFGQSKKYRSGVGMSIPAVSGLNIRIGSAVVDGPILMDSS